MDATPGCQANSPRRVTPRPGDAYGMDTGRVLGDHSASPPGQEEFHE